MLLIKFVSSIMSIGRAYPIYFDEMKVVKMHNTNVLPFIKWAGGKRQLLKQIRERMPKEFNEYHEPFVGGGAVLFDLLPTNATINDINKALINTYQKIKEVPEDFLGEISLFDKKIVTGGKEYYYKVREHFNNKIIKVEYDVELAALFVFLNKHCFNGLYRVNGKGLFNVPYNNSIKESCNSENIMAVSKYLQDIKIMEGDFQKACDLSRRGDFVFIDSPYAPLNSTSFEAYTKEGFDRESHIRLAETFRELSNRGCYCMLTNHNTELINELYEDFNKETIDVRRMINSDATKRVGKEIIITNY